MITPDAPDRQYSTRLRTALVLTGTGTAGAYHAGVLRALHEAGVKIDLVAGRGAGTIGALFAAVDGGARLWEDKGLWRSSSAAAFYGPRGPVRVAGWALAAAGLLFAIPLALLAVAVIVGIVGLLLTLVGLGGPGAVLTGGFSRWVQALFDPSALPTVIPRLVLFALLVGVAALGAGLILEVVRGRTRRRTRHGLLWRLVGAPLSARGIVERTAAELWHLIRGAAPLSAPASGELGRKYVELLSDNLGQPGFRELLLTVHDMDARRDLVFALLAPAHRPRFFGPRGASDPVAHTVEAFDLAGVGRDHAMDALAASLALPIATDPHLVTFAPEGPWRGETHRLCDRPEALSRVLEEVAAAGAEQVILLTASAVPARAHELSAGRADLRGRAGELLAAFESAGVRDVLEQFAGRFAGLFVIRPNHNPIGPLDFTGVYDERSDRVRAMGELTDRGYEDAYRQFIEPVLALGERIEPSQATRASADGTRTMGL